MQFAVLVYEKPGTYEALSAAELQQMNREYLEIAQLPGYVGGAQLQSIETASAVRVEGGETLITDGPFASTKEAAGRAGGSHRLRRRRVDTYRLRADARGWVAATYHCRVPRSVASIPEAKPDPARGRAA